jgi:hypothetical protein
VVYRCTRNMSEEQVKNLDRKETPMTATEVTRRQQERAAEQDAVIKASVESIMEVMLAPILNCALEREADKVSKLMEDIKLLQDSEAALKNEVAILQEINTESAGQILELEQDRDELEQRIVDLQVALSEKG